MYIFDKANEIENEGSEKKKKILLFWKGVGKAVLCILKCYKKVIWKKTQENQDIYTTYDATVVDRTIGIKKSTSQPLIFIFNFVISTFFEYLIFASLIQHCMQKWNKIWTFSNKNHIKHLTNISIFQFQTALKLLFASIKHSNFISKIYVCYFNKF
jgi:hypothetical protein